MGARSTAPIRSTPSRRLPTRSWRRRKAAARPSPRARKAKLKHDWSDIPSPRPTGRGGKIFAMLILMKAGASKEDVAAVEKKVRDLGFTPNDIPGATRMAIGITGNQGPLDPGIFTVMSGVADAVPVSKPWKLVSREVKPDDTAVRLGPTAQIGGGKFGVIAGPCA